MHMTTRFLIGRAGSGKTRKCLEEIREKLLGEPTGVNPLILLVPEQATFQAEHDLITTPNLPGLIRAQVLSFRTLSWRVMQETGNVGGIVIDEIGKKLLLQRILQKHREQFKMFQSASEKMGFIDELFGLFSELNHYCIHASELLSSLSGIGSNLTTRASQIQAKLEDIEIVYREYEELMATCYLDSDKYLNILADQLPDSISFKGAELWIDGFYSMTPQELAVIASGLRHFENVTISLCLDRAYTAEQEPLEMDIFYPTAKTMVQIQQCLQQMGMPPAEVVILNDDVLPRYRKSPMLAHLERNYEHRLSTKCPIFEGNGDEITIYSAANRRAEIDGAAREILRLIRDEGLRYRDLQVRVRNLEDYGDMIRTQFMEYEIPIFLDQKRSVFHHPLVEFIRSALDIILHNWRFDAVFRCVKTDFLLELDSKPTKRTSKRVSRQEMDELENLVLAYGIQGSRWTDTKSWNFKAYQSIEDETVDMEDELFNQRMDNCRRAVSRPLKNFQKKLKAASNVKAQVEALYNLLENVKVPQILFVMSDEAQAEGNPEKAKIHAQIWENCIQMLEQMVDIMGEDTISIELFTQLVETGLDSIRQGLVPPSLDQVLIGNLDRTRSSQAKVVLVLGVNDGILPSAKSEDGLITEYEREVLHEAGLQIAETSRRRLLDEQFLIYTVLCAPSHRLWLSYPYADDDGKSMLPSEVIKHVKGIFPKTENKQLSTQPSAHMDDEAQLEFVSGAGIVLSHLVIQLKDFINGTNIHEGWFEVYNFFLTHETLKGKMDMIANSLSYNNQEEMLREQTSLSLYGKSLQSSVSRMERFVACPFSHFASNGLRLEERKTYRLEAPAIGQLYHAALSKLMKDLEIEGKALEDLTEEELFIRVSYIVDTLSPRVHDNILTSSARFQYISRKLKQVLFRSGLALKEHAKRGSFKPIGFEVCFGPNEKLPALNVDLDNGRSMNIVGRIDRIDHAVQDNTSLLRIVDYKSSSTNLELSKVYHGLSLQMLTYLDVVLTYSEHLIGETALPAAVLYFHVHNPMIQDANPLAADSVEKEVWKEFRTKGLVLADEDVVKLMDGSISSHSELLPVSLKSDGSFMKKSSIAQPEQWDQLRNHVRKTIQEIGSEIMNGKVDIAPYRMGKRSACDFCPQKSVCQFEPLFTGNGHRTVDTMADDTIWEIIKCSEESSGS